MFESLLIANRGEIACRVMRTARRMGIRTIAVYSAADREALHVREADVALEIGPAPATESYLVIEALLEAARRSGAQAIHPGYGFLSENAAFAEACAAAGVCFVGPPPAAIRAMGLKDAAKLAMERAGVPVVPGYHGDAQGGERLAQEAERIGYPVLIKAVAGGGGKGMRCVEAASEFGEALAAAQREARAAFGDERVLIEKFLTQPRHIEVQVFADRHGNAVHVFERDCSLQRRHQKVVEEAPAPGMGEAMRGALGEAAVRAAKAIDYEGAGTCEFIVDVSDGLEQAPFYFMEMNTRLQVEHPVTEAISGQDLVEWQLRVAAGERLPRTQSELHIAGHAIEVRLYAEDPARDYLPQTGVLSHLRWPQGPGVRVDTGVCEGDAVSVHYDPLLAKLICHGDSRGQALTRLRRALLGVEVVGVKTNLALLFEVASHPAFEAAELDTNFLARHAASLLAVRPEIVPRALQAATLAELCSRAQVAAQNRSPWVATDAFQLNLPCRETVRWSVGEAELGVEVEPTDDGYRLFLEEAEPLRARGVRFVDHALTALTEKGALRSRVVPSEAGWVVLNEGHVVPVDRAQEQFDASGQVATNSAVLAPMPGKVLAVLVQAGDTVDEGQVLLRLEAMKMEHALRAPVTSVVERIRVNAGDQVEEGALLLSLVDPALEP